MVPVKLLAAKVATKLREAIEEQSAHDIYRKYRDLTMLSEAVFVSNLMLCRRKAPAAGCIVECGVWRGGMSAGMSDVLPGRVHYLFDSFEGLPPAQEIDGEVALAWQRDAAGPAYFDNCRAERVHAESAMRMSAAGAARIVGGWFSDTVPGFVPSEPIAVLRLDADWYDSTLQCLTGLYPHVQPGGLVIVDDYYVWDGCSRAIHDFLSLHKRVERIEQSRGVCYFVKRSSSSPAPP
ncbi:MAG TPA: TylF/MycF/NovP-related O-methyltransferase [Burkholderiales bacterium]|nr:TylF/MycF/NovP-related O-methyltransferase [Burkholderiales bacterium]